MVIIDSFWKFSNFRPDSTVLILSGSHGSEEGVSGLTDNNPRNVDDGYGFYREDCELLGIKPGPPKRSQRLPLRNWNGIPDITKPAEKVDGYVDDSSLQDMDIRVCNICYYYDNSQKLVDDIQQVEYRNLKKNFFLKYNFFRSIPTW